MISICVRSEENNLGLYTHGSNEMLLKDLKKLVLSKLKILWKISRKIAKMILKTNGTKRECMDSLFMKLLVQSNLKVQTKATICAAQEHALRSIIQRIKLTRHRKTHCVECVVKGEKVCTGH